MAVSEGRPARALRGPMLRALVLPLDAAGVQYVLNGSVAALAPRAVPVRAWGAHVWIAHAGDLLATLRPDRETKHRDRYPLLEAARASAEAGVAPRGLESLESEEA